MFHLYAFIRGTWVEVARGRADAEGTFQRLTRLTERLDEERIEYNIQYD
jgi:hypothetical protein